MKRMNKLAAAVAALMIAGTAATFAQQQNDHGYEIMKEVADFKEPKFSHSMVYMTLTDKKGTSEKWGVEQYGKSENDLASVVMLFRTGSKKDTRFLQIENEGSKPDDKFIYLPELKSTRRVNSSEGSKSFLGTDATYDDLSTRDVEEDWHYYEADESKNGYDCYRIRETPKDAKSSQYKYRITWIDKKTMYPVYTEMYDKNGRLVKTLEVKKIEKKTGATGETYDVPMGNVLTNVQTGHSTTLEIVQIEIDKQVPARVFTQNFLSTGK